MTARRKYRTALVTLLVVAWVLWLTYVPEHWMTRAGFGTVKIDGRTVSADVYIGNPTQSEAEAITLVHVPGVGNYFFSFEDENYREASDHEFVRVFGGAWTFKSMREGQFSAPLPFQNLNGFSVSSRGHIVIVQF
jgi:hypothetical protein